jgi:hypothetical protein
MAIIGRLRLLSRCPDNLKIDNEYCWVHDDNDLVRSRNLVKSLSKNLTKGRYGTIILSILDMGMIVAVEAPNGLCRPRHGAATCEFVHKG